jgi:hypothetical protein
MNLIRYLSDFKGPEPMKRFDMDINVFETDEELHIGGHSLLQPQL